MNQLFIFVSVLLFVSCQRKEKKPEDFLTNTKHFTWEKVKSIASKYGIEDSVSLENSSICMYYEDTTKIEEFMEKLYRNYEFYGEEQRFIGLARKVHSLSEYFILLNQFPQEKKSLEMMGLDRKSLENINCNVYIDTIGYPELMVIPKDLDVDTQKNARLLSKK